jgi:hypothetical protein
MANNEDEKKPKEVTLLQELCGADAELYACLSTLLYENPLAVISPKDLDSLTQEADKSGKFRPALDKAVFEGARNPQERERYTNAIQDLASKTIHAMEQERETALKEGLTDLAASLGRRIETQGFMRERAADILRVASRFYSEKLTTLAEDKRREERLQGKRVVEREEKKIGEVEKAGREAKKQARRGMGGRERRDAKKEDRREELAAAERKEARGEGRRAAEREETRIGEAEKVGREARRAERRGK